MQKKLMHMSFRDEREDLPTMRKKLYISTIATYPTIVIELAIIEATNGS